MRVIRLKNALMLCLLVSISTQSFVALAAQRGTSFARTAPRPNTKLAEESSLPVRITPLMDLYYVLRSHAASKSANSVAIDGFEEAVEATREIQKVFGGPTSGAWGLLDIGVASSRNTAALMRNFARLPESVRGGAIPVRENALRLAKAMSTIEPVFLKKIWPQHESLLEKSSAQIKHLFGSREQACLDFIVKNLALEGSNTDFDFYLVVESPDPGSITYFLRDGPKVTVISASTDRGLSTAVAILYEATHILRHVTTKANALTDLAQRLQRAGLSEAASQDAVLTLIFVQSMETVHRILKASIKRFQNAQESEARFPLMKTIVPVWTKYLNGESSYDHTLDQLVDACLKASKKS